MENHNHHQENTTPNQHEQEATQLFPNHAPKNTENAINFAQQVIPDADFPLENPNCPWHRTKWTEKMVKLLITTLSYVDEDAWRRNHLLLRKMGKWRCVSKVMSEMGHSVSPQQCEDEYNNLNKAYRRLNELLGRDTSCNIVANPHLLDAMEIAEDDKEEARSILTSKHLFFEEMCSFHNQNRVYLPHDCNVLQCVHCVLSKFAKYVACGSRQSVSDMLNEDDEGNDSDEEIGIGFGSNFGGLRNEGVVILGEEEVAKRSQKLAEQKLKLKAERLKLESKKIKWQQSCIEEDMKLKMMRLENESMKLENKRIKMELKQKITSNKKDNCFP